MSNTTTPTNDSTDDSKLPEHLRVGIVIPVYNEAPSLRELFGEIADVCDQHTWEVTLMFVDDGSTDDSWKVIESLCKEDPRVNGIRFRRNFGKASALQAGFEQIDCAVVFTMDADLQDHPQELPRFLAKMNEGYDVISGWKKVRHDPFHKRYPSKVFNWLVGALTGVRLNDHNCGFKCYRREIFNEVRLYGELHRFVPVLAAARGWRVGELVVEHRPRQHGSSKYGFTRFVKGFLDLLTVCFLTGYRQRPQHVLGTLGLASFALGFLGLAYLSIYWLIRVSSPDLQEAWAPVHQRPLLIYSFGGLLLGAQLLSMGFLAELITASNSEKTDTFSIRSMAGQHVGRSGNDT